MANKPYDNSYYEMVDVPKKALPVYGGMAWDDVIAAAKEGRDGLSVVASQLKAPDYDEADNGRWGAPPLGENVARLRKVDGRAFLFLQNWPAPFYVTRMLADVKARR